MSIIDRIKHGLVLFDGGTGTLLQARGLEAGNLPEEWNITHPEVITEIHRQYIEAGCDIIKTNTFGANRIKFGGRLEEVISAAMNNAHGAAGENTFVALDIGPTGKLLKPYGDLDFEDAVSVFAETVQLGAQQADLVLIETMTDIYELKAAVLAAKENCSLPVFATVAVGEDGKMMTGADAGAVVAMLEGMGVDALGLNCGFGPDVMMKIIPDYIKYSSLPVIANPNAGIPKYENMATVYDVTPEMFAADMAEIIRMGARIVGGCCGTTPAHITALRKAAKELDVLPVTEKNITVVSSYTHAVAFGGSPVLIGERINPTGKPKLKEALRGNNTSYILNEGIAQAEKGVHILDVNVGLPGLDEKKMLCDTVSALQEVLDLPLQIDTSDPIAMEAALRRYNGKALINSVNGKKESMDAILPLAAKYGGVLIALTLDESGIPDSADGRVEIAEKICAEAAKYGIARKNIIVDPLALTISSDRNAAAVTLATVRLLTEKNIKTSLGVSNVSFGLPSRENINTVFFSLALGEGLKAAIMNPYSDGMMNVYRSFRALRGFDESCREYIAAVTEATETQSGECTLRDAVIKGLKTKAGELAAVEVAANNPLDVINTEVIPALDEVGRGFESNRIYLPQLLMSAEAAKCAFDVIRAAMPKSAEKGDKIILATVKGDIHDIGKNIVKALLENYGYDVIDLGRDVASEKVVEAVLAGNVKLVGLSALMTTTVVSMEETIKQLRASGSDCKIVVGGAVMTAEYAAMIGADKYCRDAMETVRYAGEVFGKNQ